MNENDIMKAARDARNIIDKALEDADSWHDFYTAMREACDAAGFARDYAFERAMDEDLVKRAG